MNSDILTHAGYPYPAPAKLNLFLHIVGVRDDGMHRLQTLFRLLDYGDSLDCKTRTDGEIRMHCDAPGLDGDDNLAVRAARLLQTTCNVPQGADIYLEKRIPIGAGLGGGSSDAATTLCVLNRLWECALNREQLSTLGARLGADVPLFINGLSAWGEGLGERLTPVELKQAWYAVFVPDAVFDTGQQFAHADLERDCAPVALRHYLAGLTRNVFEPIARQHTEVEHLIQWLGAHAPAKLSGSGAAVFAEFADEELLARCMSATPEGVRVFAARGVNVSPLRDKLAMVHNN